MVFEFLKTSNSLGLNLISKPGLVSVVKLKKTDS